MPTHKKLFEYSKYVADRSIFNFKVETQKHLDDNAEELNTLIEKLLQDYLEDCTNKVLDFADKSSEKAHFRVMMMLPSAKICGYDVDLAEPQTLGNVYAAAYYALTGNKADSSDCIALNKYQEDVIERARNQLDKKFDLKKDKKGIYLNTIQSLSKSKKLEWKEVDIKEETKKYPYYSISKTKNILTFLFGALAGGLYGYKMAGSAGKSAVKTRAKKLNESNTTVIAYGNKDGGWVCPICMNTNLHRAEFGEERCENCGVRVEYVPHPEVE